jgi:phosphatidylinositol alpha-mannosyltransferase
VKVGLVSPYDLGRHGGVQAQVLQLGSWLEEEGHEVVVVGPGAGPAGTVSLGDATVITVNGAAAPIRLDPKVGSAIAAATAGCDVVHVHEPLMPMVGLAAARLPGTALVGTFHADPSAAVRRLYRWSRGAIRRIVRRFDVLTAVSPVAAGAVLPFAGTVEVPNGIDMREFDPSPGVARRVAFLGRDDPRKGLDVLLRAWPTVASAVPDAELIVAAGDRHEDLAGARFIGAVSDEAKRRLLADAAVFCAPNLGGESFGIILTEAMASRCAVVASALPAFAHVLADTGVLVKPGDHDGLAQSLVALLGNADRIERLQTSGFERVRRFDRAAVLTAYVDAYETALARHGAGRH